MFGSDTETRRVIQSYPPPVFRWLCRSLTLLGVLCLIPPLLILDARYNRARAPRVHPIPDMDNQARYKAQMEHPRFADGRAMRYAPEGTVARGSLQLDDHLYRGVVDGKPTTTYPSAIDVDFPFVERGRERYDIYCAPCHGRSGDGKGTVAIRASVVSEATWVPPTNLHARTTPDDPVNRPVGYLYLVISNGVRNMPAYASMISVEDRWAIVAYVRSLQRSQYATLDQISAPARAASRDWPVQPREDER